MEVDSILKRFGQDVRIADDEGWSTEIFRAFVQPIRYKNKMYLEGIYTPAGLSEKGYYLYIGPPSHDLIKLEDAAVFTDELKLKIERAEKVYFQNKVCYIWAVLMSVTQEE